MSRSPPARTEGRSEAGRGRSKGRRDNFRSLHMSFPFRKHILFMFDCRGSGSVCCSRLRPEAHQKQPQKQPFPLSAEVGGGGQTFSSRHSALQPPPLAALVLGETQRSKFLEILQAFLAPWDENIRLEFSWALRMPSVSIRGIF